MAPCKILIIDDDHDDVEILSELFKNSGVDSIHHVNTARLAFSYLQEFDSKADLPKLIITDAYLPGTTGAAFLADLKIIENYKHIHVIVLSSVKIEKEIQQFLQLGASDYFVKPHSYDEYKEVAALIKSRFNNYGIAI